MRCFIGVFAIVLIASQGLEPGTAKAWGSYRERLTLELELGAGVLGQNTTGVGAPLLSSGYDRQPGLALDLGWRVLVRDNRYYRHGVMLRGLYQAGPFLGVGGYGFRFGVVELAYSGRVLFPCMSDDRREVSLEAHIGIGGGYADAGLGTGEARINDAAARREAATSLDHGILGYVTGVELDARFGALFVGLGLDLRQHFGLSTVADRHFLPSAMLRLGAVTELDGGGS